MALKSSPQILQFRDSRKVRRVMIRNY